MTETLPRPSGWLRNRQCAPRPAAPARLYLSFYHGVRETSSPEASRSGSREGHVAVSGSRRAVEPGCVFASSSRCVGGHGRRAVILRPSRGKERAQRATPVESVNCSGDEVHGDLHRLASFDRSGQRRLIVSVGATNFVTRIRPYEFSVPWVHQHLHVEVRYGAASVHGEFWIRRNTVGRDDFVWH